VPDASRTVDGRGRAAFEVRGSAFVGLVAPADGVAAAESFLDAVRADHPDATHVVPAYRVPAGDEAGAGTGDPSDAGGGDPAATAAPGPQPGGLLREYASDDGEPSGSAGTPALNVLQAREVRNVAAAVVRWYGGTNLGVGGLARAYGRAVGDALDAAGVVERAPRARLRIVTAYDDSGTVRGVIESAGAAFDADYAERVTFNVRLPAADAAALVDRLRSATGGRVEVERR